MEPIVIHPYNSPCGEMILGSIAGRLCLCDWKIENRREAIDRRLRSALGTTFLAGTSEVIEKTASQLDEYFTLGRNIFDIPLLMVGTDFQKSVWKLLLDIPYGQSISYGDLARALANEKAVRAVAAANGANPISILVPCHRVIGSDGKLTGYGGGLEAKKFLLELEAGTQVSA